MRLVVLGATGGIGLEVVGQAVERGHHVTAFVRSPERLGRFAGKIRVLQGDLLNAVELGHALDGHDAVISGFGPRLPLTKGDADLRERFANALASASSRTRLRRTVIVSTAFLFRDWGFPPAYLVGRLFFPTVVRDAAAMEQTITKSSLDWTLVRPPQLTDKPRTGQYRVREAHLPAFGFKIARGDVADFMIRCVEDDATSHKIMGVSN